MKYITDKLETLSREHLSAIAVQANKSYAKETYLPIDQVRSTGLYKRALTVNHDALIEAVTMACVRFVQNGGSFYTLRQAGLGTTHLPMQITDPIAVYTALEGPDVNTYAVMKIDNSHVRFVALGSYYAGPLSDRLYEAGYSLHVQEFDPIIRAPLIEWLYGMSELSGRIFTLDSSICPNSIRWDYFTKKELALFIAIGEDLGVYTMKVFPVPTNFTKSKRVASLQRLDREELLHQARHLAYTLSQRGHRVLGNALLALSNKVSPVAQLYKQ